MSLPDGESAEAVAVGGNWVALATSKRMLRIFSAGGLQRGSLLGSLALVFERSMDVENVRE